jgi:hypothetical protein
MLLRATLAGFLLVMQGGAADAAKALSRAVIASGHKQAKCSVPLKEALAPGEVMDLGRGLKLVEIYCWRAAYNFGSILFVVPAKQPGAGRLLRFPEWNDKKIGYSYSLSSPSYDPETKKLGASHKLRGAGDCGSITEWLWTGKDFKLSKSWFKEECDGESMDDDNIDKYQVYPPKR